MKPSQHFPALLVALFLGLGISTASEKNKHVFYLGSSYGSNLYYLGTSVSDDRGFLSTDLSYGYDSVLWISGSLYNLPGYSSALPFYDLSAGLNLPLGKSFDLGLTLARHQLTSRPDTLFFNYTYALVSLGLDWKLLYSRLAVGRTFGEYGQTYLNLKNSRYMQSGNFFANNSFFSLEPSVNLYFGSFYRLHSRTISSGPGPGVRPGHGTGNWQYNYYTKGFGLLDVEFSIPVAFNAGIFTLEMEPVYLLPVFDDQSIHSAKGFSFFISAYVRLSRKK